MHTLSVRSVRRGTSDRPLLFVLTICRIESSGLDPDQLHVMCDKMRAEEMLIRSRPGESLRFARWFALDGLSGRFLPPSDFQKSRQAVDRLFAFR